MRQFGALGVESGSPKTLANLITYDLFTNFAEALATYPGAPGSPFSGLKDTETFDWVAIQAALAWCGAEGVRCEVPSGVFKVSRPVWMGDDTTYAVDSEDQNIETSAKDSTVMGLTFRRPDRELSSTSRRGSRKHPPHRRLRPPVRSEFRPPGPDCR